MEHKMPTEINASSLRELAKKTQRQQYFQLAKDRQRFGFQHFFTDLKGLNFTNLYEKFPTLITTIPARENRLWSLDGNIKGPGIMLTILPSATEEDYKEIRALLDTVLGDKPWYEKEPEQKSTNLFTNESFHQSEVKAFLPDVKTLGNNGANEAVDPIFFIIDDKGFLNVLAGERPTKEKAFPGGMKESTVKETCLNELLEEVFGGSLFDGKSRNSIAADDLCKNENVKYNQGIDSCMKAFIKEFPNFDTTLAAGIDSILKGENNIDEKFKDIAKLLTNASINDDPQKHILIRLKCILYQTLLPDSYKIFKDFVNDKLKTQSDAVVNQSDPRNTQTGWMVTRAISGLVSAEELTALINNCGLELKAGDDLVGPKFMNIEELVSLGYSDHSSLLLNALASEVEQYPKLITPEIEAQINEIARIIENKDEYIKQGLHDRIDILLEREKENKTDPTPSKELKDIMNDVKAGLNTAKEISDRLEQLFSIILFQDSLARINEVTDPNEKLKIIYGLQATQKAIEQLYPDFNKDNESFGRVINNWEENLSKLPILDGPYTQHKMSLAREFLAENKGILGSIYMQAMRVPLFEGEVKNTDQAYYLEHNLTVLSDKLYDADTKKLIVDAETTNLIVAAKAAISKYRTAVDKLTISTTEYKQGISTITDDGLPADHPAVLKLTELSETVSQKLIELENSSAKNIDLDFDDKVGFLVVDWQRGFIDLDYELSVADAKSCLEDINKLICRFMPANIAYSRDMHAALAIWTQHRELGIGGKFSEIFMQIHKHCGGCHWCDHCVRGTPGASYGNGLILRDGAKHVAKGTTTEEHQFGAVYGYGSKSLGLIEYYRKQGLDTIVVSGLATDFCVRDSVRQLLAAGFNVVVAKSTCRGIFINGDADTAAVYDNIMAPNDYRAASDWTLEALRKDMLEQVGLQGKLGDSIGQLKVVEGIKDIHSAVKELRAQSEAIQAEPSEGIEVSVTVSKDTAQSDVIALPRQNQQSVKDIFVNTGSRIKSYVKSSLGFSNNFTSVFKHKSSTFTKIQEACKQHINDINKTTPYNKFSLSKSKGESAVEIKRNTEIQSKISYSKDAECEKIVQKYSGSVDEEKMKTQSDLLVAIIEKAFKKDGKILTISIDKASPEEAGKIRWYIERALENKDLKIISFTGSTPDAIAPKRSIVGTRNSVS